MPAAERFDAVIVGAGQGGGPLAGRQAGAGWTTALAEQEHLGGMCVNVGWTPTKTMVASARIAHAPLAEALNNLFLRMSDV